MRTNGYWLNSVLSLSSRNNDQLLWPVSLIDDFGSISTKEVNDLAQRYITGERRAVGIVRSAGSSELSSVDQSTNRTGVLPDDNG